MSSHQMLEAIIDGCVKEDRNSQKKMYKQYYCFAMGICMRYASNYMEAEEIVNDSFLKIYNSLKNFKPTNNNLESSFVGWIKKIMIHTAIDSYRKNNKAKPIFLNEDNYPDLVDQCESAIEKMSYEEIVALVHDLSPTYRTVFNLYAIDGFKHEQIATQLNISIGTSKSNLAKARYNIQKMLQQQNIKLYEERRAI